MENYFEPFHPKGEISVTRRYLPHWEQSGTSYFVTFRTADSLPKECVRHLRELRNQFLLNHPVPWSYQERRLYSRIAFGRLDKWLDAGHGECLLCQPEASEVVENSLRHFDGRRYFLDEFVIMPNHLHLIVLPTPGVSLKSILHSWKSYSAKRINACLGRSGRFWMPESFDRIVRSWEGLEAIRQYIRDNPAKAGLAEAASKVGKGIKGR